MPLTRAATLAAFTDAQAGAVSRRQVRSCGMTDAALRAEVLARRWQRALPGVYVTFTGPLPYRTRCWVALLYAGAGAVLSHETAAWYDGWCTAPPSAVHLSVPHTRRVRAQHGLTVHRSTRLDNDVRALLAPPRTRTERTVLDLVDASTSVRDAVAVLAAALSRRVTTEARLRTTFESAREVRWRGPVLRTLEVVAGGAESPLEVDHDRIERLHGLPPCRRQVRMHFEGRVCRVDAVDEYGLVRELDGRSGHEDARSAWRDKRRDNANVIAGRTVLRFGHVDLVGDQCGVARQEIAALRRLGWRGTPRRCGAQCSATEPG